MEICVPGIHLQEAAACLVSTRLFESEELKQFDCFTKYKRGFPRLRSTTWSTLSFAVTIFSDISQGLNPLDKSIVPSTEIATCASLSPQISDTLFIPLIRSLKWPRLPSLFLGLCQRHIDNGDDIARIGAEQLVDGMDLSKQWCDTNLPNASPKVLALTYGLIAEKAGRMDPFSGNRITCYIPSESDAQLLRQLPGYHL